MSLLKIIKTVHLWIGLTVGLIVSFCGITGAIYVWEPEITSTLSKDILSIDKNITVSYDDILATAESLKNTYKDSILNFYYPYRNRQTIAIDFLDGTKKFYHPKTGIYLGNKSSAISFFETVLKLHRTLLIKNIGKYIVGWSSLIFALIILGSGMYLWIKIYKKRWKKGFHFNRFSKKKAFNFNLHKVAGIYFVIPLFIISITGIYFTFNKDFKALLNTIPSFDKISSSNVYIPKLGTPFQLHKTIKELQPIYKIRSINYPRKRKNQYRFRFINNNTIKSGLRKPIEIKTTKKFIITNVISYEHATLGNKIANQMFPIHIGEILGLSSRIFVFICGFIPLTLYITGIRFYLFRKKYI